jgi:hypothetical protein
MFKRFRERLTLKNNILRSFLCLAIFFPFQSRGEVQPKEMSSLEWHVKQALQLLPNQVSALYNVRPVKIEIERIGKLNGSIMGVYTNFFGNPAITVNSLWLSKIKNFGDKDQQIVRVLAHELSHYWDSQLNYKLSRDSRLMTILGWKFRRSGVKVRNELGSRLPNGHELDNAQEAFAYNIENFLFESEYECRNPVAFDYISRVFFSSAKPTFSRKMKCSEKFPILLSDMSSMTFSKLDVSKIVAIDYLVAGPGPAVESRFGHSMLRLIFCDKSDVESVSICRKKLDSQIVVQFGATITDLQMSYAKGMGLFGSYPSTINFSTFISTKIRYNDGEQRGLFSYPLTLSHEDLQRAIRQLVYMEWAYESRYNFFVTNCVTEVLDFIRAIAWQNGKIFRSTPNRPQSLLTNLISSGLVESELHDVDQLKLRPNLYYPANTKAMMVALTIVSQRLKINHMNLKDYMNLAHAQRASLLNCNRVACDKKAVVAGLYLQSIFTNHLKTEIESQLYETILSGEIHIENGPDNEKLNSMRIEMLQFRSPGVLAQGSIGFGIPSESEMEVIEEQIAKNKANYSDVLQFTENILNYADKAKMNELKEERELQIQFNQALTVQSFDTAL